MKSATAPALNPNAINPYGGTDPVYSDCYFFREVMHRGVWEHHLREENGSSYTRQESPRYAARIHTGTADYEVTILQYGDLFIFDFEEPASEFPEEHQEAVDHLRSHGRPLLADKLITMLRDVADDPDAPMISVVSLRDMARVMTEHRNFSDPVIGPDRLGIIHGQWRTTGNGILVISFLGHGDVLLIAQSSGGPHGDGLNISDRGPKQEILLRHGHLVPSRN